MASSRCRTLPRHCRTSADCSTQLPWCRLNRHLLNRAVAGRWASISINLAPLSSSANVKLRDEMCLGNWGNATHWCSAHPLVTLGIGARTSGSEGEQNCSHCSNRHRRQGYAVLRTKRHAHQNHERNVPRDRMRDLVRQPIHLPRK